MTRAVEMKDACGARFMQHICIRTFQLERGRLCSFRSTSFLGCEVRHSCTVNFHELYLRARTTAPSSRISHFLRDVCEGHVLRDAPSRRHAFERNRKRTRNRNRNRNRKRECVFHHESSASFQFQSCNARRSLDRQKKDRMLLSRSFARV